MLEEDVDDEGVSDQLLPPGQDVAVVVRPDCVDDLAVLALLLLPACPLPGTIVCQFACAPPFRPPMCTSDRTADAMGSGLGWQLGLASRSHWVQAARPLRWQLHARAELFTAAWPSTPIFGMAGPLRRGATGASIYALRNATQLKKTALTRSG